MKTSLALASIALFLLSACSKEEAPPVDVTFQKLNFHAGSNLGAGYIAWDRKESDGSFSTMTIHKVDDQTNILFVGYKPPAQSKVPVVTDHGTSSWRIFYCSADISTNKVDQDDLIGRINQAFANMHTARTRFMQDQRPKLGARDMEHSGRIPLLDYPKCYLGYP